MDRAGLQRRAMSVSAAFDPQRDPPKVHRLLLSRLALERLAPMKAIFEGLELGVFEADGTVDASDETSLAQPGATAAYLSGDILRAGLLPAVSAHLSIQRGPVWVQSAAAGIDHPAFRAMVTAGTRLTKSGAQAPAIADYVVSHALALLHPIEQQKDAQRERLWRAIPFRELADTRWLIIGFGPAGTAVAERIRGFGAHLTVVRRNLAPLPFADAVVPMSALPEVLPHADVIVLACALNAETRDIADDRFFAAIKTGAILINVGRGALVDEEALRAGLEKSRPEHAVLDVVRNEPLGPDSWLWDHPRVRLSAHCSGLGSRTTARNDQLFIDNLVRYRTGAPLLNEVGVDDFEPALPADRTQGAGP